MVSEPNHALRRAREGVESPHSPGEAASRQDMAELVNAWVWEHRGEPVELDANYIGKLERGAIRRPQEQYRAALRAITGAATDRELGFHRRNTAVATVEHVDRKSFLRATAGAGLGITIGGQPLAELLNTSEPTPAPTRVGVDDVEEIRTTAQVFGSWDHHYGGGLAREAVVAQLRYSASLLDAKVPASLHNDLFAAVGFLGQVCAAMAFDACAHADARRYFRFAHACAEEAGDWNLRAKALSSMARQAIWVGDPDNGLTLTELALVRADRLTSTERAMLLVARARALAKLGRTEETLAAIGQADDEFSHADPANEPAWMRYYDTAQHNGDTGHALWDLAINGYPPDEATVRLARAVDGHTDAYARSRTISGIKLASLTMATGDPAEAATIGQRVLDDAKRLRSNRAADDLRDLERMAAPYQSLDDVDQLRHGIRASLAVS